VLAARSREAPGATKKGDKRDADGRTIAPGEQFCSPEPDGHFVHPGETGKSEHWSYRKLVEWVWQHLDTPRCPPTSDGRARSLWQWATKNKGQFLSKYVPMLMKGSKDLEEPEKESEEAVLGDSMKTINRYMDETGYGKPPHDWMLNYQDARNCPLKDDCPAIKAAREQAARATKSGNPERIAFCARYKQDRGVI
jgi:hypothetical protein